MKDNKSICVDNFKPGKNEKEVYFPVNITYKVRLYKDYDNKRNKPLETFLQKR